MSRYVKHKNGLILGSDNVFFVIDRADAYQGEPPLTLPDGVDDLRDGYRAIVSVDGYYFDRVSTAHVGIRTPVEQLISDKREITWKKECNIAGKQMTLPFSRTYWVLRAWVEKWLNEKVGAKYDRWDTYTRPRDRGITLFFKRRSDALAFIRMINGMMTGMRIGLH